MAKPARKKSFHIFYKKGEVGAIDPVFLILVLCLLTFGLIMIASAGYVSALQKYGDSYHYIKRQLLFAVLGVAAMLLISRIDYHILQKLLLPIMGVSGLLLVLVAIPGIGVKVNGARRWLNFGVQFQPSELAKLAVIIFLAAYIASNYKRMKEAKVAFTTPLLIIFGTCGLLMLEPHLSGALLIFGVGVVMLFVGGASIKWLVSAFLAGVAAVAGFIIATPYAKTRLAVYWNPYLDPTGDGFQTIQSLYAIGSGGLLGLGLGQSRQKFLYIPEPHNDYIFSIVCEELGFIGAMMVIILFVLLIWRGIVISYHAKDKFGSLMVVGIISRVAIQTILNIGVVTKAIPPTGISLPFFSYGGTALLVLLVEMGIVLSISRRSGMENQL